MMTKQNLSQLCKDNTNKSIDVIHYINRFKKMRYTLYNLTPFDEVHLFLIKNNATQNLIKLEIVGNFLNS